jgi:hypothetical protein
MPQLPQALLDDVEADWVDGASASGSSGGQLLRDVEWLAAGEVAARAGRSREGDDSADEFEVILDNVDEFDEVRERLCFGWQSDRTGASRACRAGVACVQHAMRAHPLNHFLCRVLLQGFAWEDEDEDATVDELRMPEDVARDRDGPGSV